MSSEDNQNAAGYSAAFLRHIVDTMPGKIVVRDGDSRIIFANTAFAEPYGLTTEEVVGKLNADLWLAKGRPAEQVAGWISEDREILRTGEGREYVQEIKRAGGEMAYFHNYKKVIELNGRSYLLAQYADITERQQMGLALARAQAQAAELAGIRKTVVTYAHQINNPLTGIMALADEIRDHLECPPEFGDLLAELKTAAERIRDVVKQLEEINEPTSRRYLERHEMLDLEGK
ncbi:PAS domain S-box protein [bacterium]|nr:PAS domain S-box protein [bacterium]